MRNHNIENILYEYRHQAVGEEVRSKIPNTSNFEVIRHKAQPKSDDPSNTNIVQQVLYRSGMMVIVGIIYYVVSVVV